MALLLALKMLIHVLREIEPSPELTKLYVRCDFKIKLRFD